MRPVAHMGENVGIFIEKQTIEAIYVHLAYVVLAAALFRKGSLFSEGQENIQAAGRYYGTYICKMLSTKGNIVRMQGFISLSGPLQSFSAMTWERPFI